MTGLILATVYLYGYLSVFDWHLIWVVQYADLIGFAVVAAGVIAGFAAIILPIVENVIYSGVPKGQPNWFFIAVSAVAFAGLLGLAIYAEYRTSDPHYMHIFYACMSVFVLVVLSAFIGSHAHFRSWPNPWRATWIFMLAILGAFWFGQWLGYSILEQHGPDYDVYLKRETLNGVRVVMAMSHRMIFYSSKTIYIVPTDDVLRIVIQK